MKKSDRYTPHHHSVQKFSPPALNALCGLLGISNVFLLLYYLCMNASIVLSVKYGFENHTINVGKSSNMLENAPVTMVTSGSLRAGTRHHGEFSVMGTPSLQPFLKSYWLTPVQMTGQLSQKHANVTSSREYKCDAHDNYIRIGY